MDIRRAHSANEVHRSGGDFLKLEPFGNNVRFLLYEGGAQELNFSERKRRCVD